jgi:hypothetical protein
MRARLVRIAPKAIQRAYTREGATAAVSGTWAATAVVA